MSRRSSAASLTTSTSGSTVGEDALMKDCYNLRRRLLQTEQSIKSLNPPFVNSNSDIRSDQGMDRALSKQPQLLPPTKSVMNLQFTKTPSEPSDRPAILTLADLSPATSDSNFDLSEKLNSSNYSAQQPIRGSSSDLSRKQQSNGQQSNGDIREIDKCSIGSGDDYGEESLRKKMFKLREKNTSLVGQSNKLMTELEKMGYELHRQRNNVRLLTEELEKEKENGQDYEDRIIALEKEISSQHDALKIAEDKVLYATEQLQGKASELNEALQYSKSVQLKYQEESKLRKHLQSQLEETLRNVEELTTKITEDKERGEKQNKSRCEQLERLDRELNELTNERNELLSQNTSLEGQVAELKEEIRLLQSEGVASEEYKSSLERDNADLRSTVARQSQMVGRLEKQSSQNEEVFKLRELVKLQNEKIQYYQREIEQSKEDMSRLEKLVQKVQEQSIRRDHHHTPSTMDSGISRSEGVVREDGGTMNGLRSELSFIAERNRINDRKQQELEQIISKLEDEAASYSSQVIQLEEKLAEKNAMNVSLEGKINQQNLRIVDVKANLEQSICKNSELQRHIHRKSLEIDDLERKLDENISDLGSYATRLHAVEQSMEEKENYISELENSVKMKAGEIAEHRTLLENTKTLHTEQCRDLERQIDQLHREYEDKNNQVSQLDAVVKACRQDLVLKTSRVHELEKVLDEHQRELEHREEQSKDYEEKLTKLQEKARLENERGIMLDQTLKECQQEMQAHVEQLVVTKNKHNQELKEKITEVSKLKEIVGEYKDDCRKKCKENELLEKTLSDKNDILKQNQMQMSELESVQTRLQQQAAILELELARERENNKEEVKKLQLPLEQARQDLDERTRQLNELNISLVGLHNDMKQSSSHVVELEQLLQQTRELLEKKCDEASKLTETLKQVKIESKENFDKCRDLETTLMETKKKISDRDEQVLELSDELSGAQEEIKHTVEQLEELKSILENNKKELKEKDEKVNELDKELNESQELLEKKNKEINEKEAKVLELDQTVRECQWELRQRVSEISKLDVSMKEQRSDLKQKTNVLEYSLSQYQYELSQKTLELSELKSKHVKIQEQLKQKTFRLEYTENTMKQQQQELRKRMDQVAKFEQEFTKLKMESDDKSEMTQELRLVREQAQHTHSELLDARRRLLQFEQKEHKLFEELEEAHGLLANKEADCSRLAKDLGAAQVREAQAEARCVQEVRRVEQQYSLKLANCENEIQQLRENHSKLFSQKEEGESSHRLNMQNLREKEKVNENEIRRLKDEQQSLNEHVKYLKIQLGQLEEEARAAQDTIVIKESEITRLQAKVSGYERATFGSRLNFAQPDSRPSSSHIQSPSSSSNPRNSKSPCSKYQSPTPVKRSSSAHDLHKITAGLISFGSPSHNTTYDNMETTSADPRVFNSESSANAMNKTDNTFERLFDQARRELDVSQKNGEGERWKSLRQRYHGETVADTSMNPHDDDTQ